MSTFTTSMFASIKDALQKDNKPAGAIADILRLTKGNSYVVRLVPNTTDPAKTFFHFYSHGWESFATGQYVSAVSPQTFGERDPIAEFRYKTNRTGSVEQKNKARAIIRSEKWLVNAYVIDDPVNPENNGKVKILRYGKQLHNILMEAIEGEDAEQFGPRIFDLGPDGCSLRVKVEDQGGYPTYVSSKFLMPGAIDGVDETRKSQIESEVIALDEVFKIKSSEELVSLLDEHYHCNEGESVSAASTETHSAAPVVAKPTADPDLEEEVPHLDPVSTTASTADDDVSLDDDKIKELLQGLDE